MIFARRALQQRLDELRSNLGEDQVVALAVRLNQAGKDRMAAMWELAVLHALAQQGALRVEAQLPSGRRPDVDFAGDAVSFVADVTSISDDGLDDQNPFTELSMMIEATKTRLGLKIGGADLRVESKTEKTRRGTRRVLRIPERRRLRDFVHDRIEPALRAQIAEGRHVLEVVIDDNTAGMKLTIDPAKSPYSSGSYASYDVPTIKDRNPLYNALRAKAGQLRGADRVSGVIVGDADSRALAGSGNGRNEIDARAIADEFLRQHRSVNFVLLLSVREEPRQVLQIDPPLRSLHALLAFSRTSPPPPALELLFRQMMEALPKPVAMPVNAALRSREAGFGWGFHGGGQMSRSRVRISAREMMEVLAGHRTIQETNAWHRWSSVGDEPQPNLMQNPFERRLLEGRMPISLAVLPGGEDSADDWIEIEFGDPDPAITPFR